MKAAASSLEVFFFVLCESYSTLAVGLQCIMKNASFLPCYGLLITYLIILSLGKKILFWKKVWKKSWILDPKICTNTEWVTEATPCHSVRIKRAFTENVTDTIDFLDLLKSPLLLFFSGRCEIHSSKILPVTSWQLTNRKGSEISRRSNTTYVNHFFPAWIDNMIEIHSGQKSRPQDFVARSVVARSLASALKLASLTFKNSWEVDS